MERERTLALQRVSFDREATAELYRKTIAVPGADKCGCLSCKNFAAQRSKVFPKEFAEFLGAMGIDPTKEWEAFDCDYDVNSSGHLYGGWFLFVGGLVAGGAEQPSPNRRPFAYWFTDSFPTGTLPDGVKYCAVEFLARVPWILAETP